MEAARNQRGKREISVQVRADRTAFTATGRTQSISAIPGFKVKTDQRVAPVGGIGTYARVRRYQSTTTSAKVVVQYKPQLGWLEPLRITMIGHDQTGITREESDSVLAQCLAHKITLLELAFDFAPHTGVDEEFVTQHGVFGKSRRRRDRGGSGQLRYGSRKSPKIVRCYAKEVLNCYRIELELHSALLRRYAVSNVAHVGHLYAHILKSHFKFMRISWGALRRHLQRKFGEQGEVLLVKTRLRAAKSLSLAMDFLRREGVFNPHRFLRSLRLNHEIDTALRDWLDGFCRVEDQETIHF